MATTPPKAREDIQSFTKADIDSTPVDETWVPHWKTGYTLMKRIDGPFKVKTREGWLRCQDGWLAVDGGGWPYPIDADVQAATYTAEDQTKSRGVLMPYGDERHAYLDAQDGWPWTLTTVLLMGAAVGAAATVLIGNLS